MFGIENIIGKFNPKTGLEILSKSITERLGIEVDKFDIYFYGGINKVEFWIFLPEQYDLTEKRFAKFNEQRTLIHALPDSEKMSKIILSIIKAYLPKDCVIDFLIIHHDKNKEALNIDAYITVKEEKQKQTFSI